MKKKSLLKKTKNKVWKVTTFVRVFASKNDGFGMNEIIGIAMGLMLAAFVIIPGLETLTKTIMQDLTDWWKTISELIT